MTRLELNLAEAARAIGIAENPDWSGIHLAGVSTDTRTIRPGELFVALRGENFDGHQFLKAAFDQGASAAVVETGTRTPAGRVCLKIADTLRALGDLAAHMRGRQPLKVIAVTGSNGKTTTKEMLVRILERRYEVLSNTGNLNNLVGLPLTLFRLRPEHEVAVLEMGMNRPGEIARLTKIAAPDVGLITCVAPAHLEGLGSIEGVARAKGELFAGLSPDALGAVNLDDPLVVKQARPLAGRMVTFGFHPRADMRAINVTQRSLRRTSFTLVTPQADVPVRFPLLGRHNVGNALAAAAAAWALGFSPARIATGLDDFPPFPGRLELKPLPGRIYLLDDTYNANPASTRAALEVLARLRGRGRAVAVLGDMLELGPKTADMHRSVGESAAQLGVDLLAAVGSEAKHVVRAAEQHASPPAQAVGFKDTSSAADWLTNHLKPNDRVLVKGSRGMRMEYIVKRLTGEKGA